MALLGKLWSFLSRSVMMAYTVIAVMGLLEVRKLLSDDFSQDGGTLTVPIMVCGIGTEFNQNTTATSITDNFGKIRFSASDIEGCRTPEYLVNAAAACLLLSAFATVIYMIISAMGAISAEAVNRSTSIGMGIFLTLILIQAAGVVSAMAFEATETEKSSADLYKEWGWDKKFGFTDVNVHCKKFVLWSAGLGAMVAAFFVLVDSCCCSCGSGSQPVRTKDDDIEMPPSPSTKSMQSSHADQPSEAGSRSWANP